MRVLFYLPGITDRHFDAVVLPLIRIMAREAEVHIAGPPQWCMTGLTERQLLQCAAMPDIQWHIFDGDDHPLLRTAPPDPQELIDFVAAIDPDYTLCRGADVATPSAFVGQTRFMMEALVPPFALEAGVNGPLMLDGPRIFDHGFMPALAAEDRDRIDRLFAPAWDAALARHAPGADRRDVYLAKAGLPADRKIIALPLTADSAANFFTKVHSPLSNAELVETMATRISDDFVLALTKHPLNVRGDPELDRAVEPLEPIAEKFAGKVRIVDVPGPARNATASLLQHCDGAVIGDTKSFGYAAFFGKPTLRLSRYDSAPWLRAYSDPDLFLERVWNGDAEVPAAEDAKTWFGYHYANNVFAAHEPDLTASEIVDRIERQVNPDRWETALARVAA